MRTRAERASATAETAVALPALVLVLAICLWALSLAANALRLADAARAAARAAARGEAEPAVVDTARRTAGDVAVTSARAGDLVTVRVTTRAAPPLPVLRHLSVVTLTRTATARVEPRGGSP